MNLIEPLKPLNLSGNIQENWQNFVKEFQEFIETSQIQSERSMISLLLTAIGKDAYQACKKDLQQLSKTATLEMVLNVFKRYCETYKNNIVYHSYKFHIRNQGDNESVEEYLSAINELAKSCEFDTAEKRMIRDKIVIGINDSDLRKKLFEDGIIELDDVVEFIKANEKKVPNNLVKDEVKWDHDYADSSNLSENYSDSACNVNIDYDMQDYRPTTVTDPMVIKEDIITISDSEHEVSPVCIERIENLDDFNHFSAQLAESSNEWETSNSQSQNQSYAENFQDPQKPAILNTTEEIVNNIFVNENPNIFNTNQNYPETNYKNQICQKEQKIIRGKNKAASRTMVNKKNEKPRKKSSSARRKLNFEAKGQVNLKSENLLTKEHKCNQCERSFSSKKCLKLHEYSHLKSICCYCGKEVKRYYLKDHLKIHTGHDLLECNECKKRYATKTSLKFHIVHSHMSSAKLPIEI